MRGAIFCFVCVLVSSALSASAAQPNEGQILKINLTVPELKVEHVDSYLCTSVELPTSPHKLVGILPLARQEVVHHILLFGCNAPYQKPTADNPHPVWDCFEHGTCQQGDTIIYGWGRNAPQLKLPDGVGFSVGEGTSIQYIVAQVHYLEIRPEGDRSGVQLQLKPQPTPYAAGLMAFATGFQIPPRASSYLVENECCYLGHQPLTTFAMRVHTHTLGKTVYMTREKHDHTGLETVGQRSPQLPQGFVAVPQTMIWPGDKLKVTCEFNSSNMSRVVVAGATHNDEMCNMYMMVYAPQPHIVMCGDGRFQVHDETPGSMPAKGEFIADPSPFWKPPVWRAEGNPLGDVTSVTIAPDGAVWALYRGSVTWDEASFDLANRIKAKSPIQEAVVVRMDPDTGAVLSSWGARTFWMPHMMSVDSASNVWVTDVGRHQVLKFSPEGELLMEIGTKLQPGNTETTFCKPTQVAVLRDGSFFVSDGYCNSRVMHFNKDGKLLYTIEVADGLVIHGVMVDECNSLIYVLNRERGKVLSYNYKRNYAPGQMWDLEGNGKVWSIRMGPFGSVLILVWKEGEDARLVSLGPSGEVSWTLPGLKDAFPHEIALTAAPVAFSGPGDRLFALLVVPTCGRASCGTLRRFILMPEGHPRPTVEQLQEHGPYPLPAKPPQGQLPDEAAELARQEAVKAGQAGAIMSGQAGKPKAVSLPAKLLPPRKRKEGVMEYSHGGVGAGGQTQAPAAPPSAKAKVNAGKGRQEKEKKAHEGQTEVKAQVKSKDGDDEKDEKDEEDEKDEKAGETESTYDYHEPPTPKAVEYPEAGAEGPGDMLEEDFKVVIDGEESELQEEGHHSWGQVLSLFILLMIVAGLIAMGALVAIRKYASPPPPYKPVPVKQRGQQDIICNSIEEMLEHSRALDEDLEPNYGDGSSLMGKQEWSAKARAHGLGQ